MRQTGVAISSTDCISSALMRVSSSWPLIACSEALKLLLGIGDGLQGRLLLFDALAATVDEVLVRRDPACPVCGDEPTVTEYVDYVGFCQGAPS